MDLVLHFSTQEAAGVLTITEHMGEVLPLIIRGNLFEEYDGARIEGRDNVWILARAQKQGVCGGYPHFIGIYSNPFSMSCFAWKKSTSFLLCQFACIKL